MEERGREGQVAGFGEGVGERRRLAAAEEDEVAHPHEVDRHQPARAAGHLVHRDPGVTGTEDVQHPARTKPGRDENDGLVDRRGLLGDDAIDDRVGNGGVLVGHRAAPISREEEEEGEEARASRPSSAPVRRSPASAGKKVLSAS